jgi:hypothetical protein
MRTRRAQLRPCARQFQLTLSETIPGDVWESADRCVPDLHSSPCRLGRQTWQGFARCFRREPSSFSLHSRTNAATGNCSWAALISCKHATSGCSRLGLVLQDRPAPYDAIHVERCDVHVSVAKLKLRRIVDACMS